MSKEQANLKKLWQTTALQKFCEKTNKIGILGQSQFFLI